MQIADDAFKGCTNLTIRGASPSYAKSFAREHNIPFVEAEDDPVVPQDRLCAADAAALEAYLLTKPAEIPDWQAYDLNRDGRLTAADLSLMLRSIKAQEP